MDSALPTETSLSPDGYLGESYEDRYHRYAERVAQVDLALVSLKVMHPNIGYGWSAEFTERLAAEYRVFFTMHAAFPDLWLPPSKVLDLFWHEHILDTRAYFRDCDFVAGEYIHHFPYFGMRNLEDVELALAAFASERELYVRCVGHEPPPDMWSVGVTREQLYTLIDGRFADPRAAEAARMFADLEL